MENYIDSKITEFSILIDWIEQELDMLEKKSQNHNNLIESLKVRIKKQREICEELKIKAEVEAETLNRSIVSYIHTIYSEIYDLNLYYIPPLQRENEDDLYLRRILAREIKRCGLSWIEDIIISLSSDYSTFSDIKFPIFYVPPHHRISLLDMPGIYHEMGHNVFLRFEEIRQNLFIMKKEYFSELKASLGSVTSEKRDERNRLIQIAAEYWNEERINETFCDIFATFVSGPSYYYFCIDFAIRNLADKIDIDHVDVHPPWPARAYVCYKALPSFYQEDEAILSIHNSWNTYIDRIRKHEAYNLFCGEKFLDRFVSMTIKEIENLSVKLQCFSEFMPLKTEISDVKEGMSLAEILHNQLKVFLTNPRSYAEWEKRALEILYNKFK